MIFDLRNSLRILRLQVGRAQTRRAWRLPASIGSRYELVCALGGGCDWGDTISASGHWIVATLALAKWKFATGYALDCLRRSALRQAGSEGWKFSALCDGFCIVLRAPGTSLDSRCLSVGPLSEIEIIQRRSCPPTRRPHIRNRSGEKSDYFRIAEQSGNHLCPATSEPDVLLRRLVRLARHPLACRKSPISVRFVRHMAL